MSFLKWTGRSLLVAAALIAALPAQARVVRVEKTSESVYGNFKTGEYLRLEYRVSGDLSDDVDLVPDLAKAEKNADGKITYATRVTLLIPSSLEGRNGTLLIDVPNRGRTLASGLFNSPRSPMLAIGSYGHGNGFLQDNGFSIAVVAWELGHGAELPQLKGDDGRARYIEGAALAIVRDVAAFLQSDASETPLGGTVKRTIGIGYSQTGRLLKSLLTKGYNEVAGREVLSGAFIFGAGSGLINLRNVEGPGSGAGQIPNFSSPELRGVTEAPFSIAEVAKLAGADRPSGPKLMFINTTTDYYSLRASLGRVGAEGIVDRPVPANVRIYDIAGASHALVPGKGECKHPYAVLDWHPILRSTLLLLNTWITTGEAPPPSSLMPLRTADGDPAVLQAPKHLPRATILVPIADPDGNAIGGVRLPDIVAPVGTHAAQNPPYSFICALGAAFVPFAAEADEAQARSDGRRSLRDRYRDNAQYVSKIKEAADALVAQKFLLPADAAEIVEAAQKLMVP